MNNKFESEIISVKQFFNNYNIDCENYIFTIKDEPCDVYCTNTDQQFQITWNEHDFQKQINTTKPGKMIEQLRTTEKMVDDFIYSPILKKINAYEASAKGIILLIISLKSLPFNQIKLNNIIKQILTFNNNFFDEIHLVCPNINYQLFKNYNTL